MEQSAFVDKLAQLRANNCDELPTPELSVLTRTIARIRREGFNASCLQVGETVPDFEFINQENSNTSFYEALSRGPAVINFFRGFWCQYCKTELQAYEKVQSQIEALGCSYFAISPQKPETASYLPENYQVIFDRGNKIAEQFGIVYTLEQKEIDLFSSWGLKLDEVNGTQQWTLPVPATFVVCSDRTIGYEYVDVDFRARCCPEQLLEEIRSFCDCV